MDAAASSAYAQLLSVGVIWMTFHCVGMCGPLVLFLNLGGHTQRAGWHLLLYQLGKALGYAIMGGVAGLLGHLVSRTLPQVTPWITGALGIMLLGWAALPPHSQAAWPGWTVLQKKLSAVDSGAPWVRSLGLGVLMSILPCGVVGWALTLAAGTRHPVHGAAVMVLLAGMTTLPLAAVVNLPKLLGARAQPLMSKVQRGLLPLSGMWMLLVSAAALGFISHLAWGWQWQGTGYTLMLY